MIISPDFTPTTPEKLAEKLWEGHARAFGWGCPERRLRVAWAQTMLETGRGERMRGNGNIGNITAGPAWKGDVYVLGELPPPDPKSLTFRAYSSLLDGCVDYWLVLSSWFHTALDAFDAGDTEAAAMRLYERGYFTANPTRYGETMEKLFKESQGKVVADPPEHPLLSREQLAELERVQAVSEAQQLEAIHEEGFRNR